MRPSPEFWQGRRVLVTGHTGFKGAWLSRLLVELGAEVSGLALPCDHPGGAFDQFEVADLTESRHVDVRDAEATSAAVQELAPQVVFHLAAQALVPEGYRRPVETFAVNVMGTAHLLDAVAGTPSVDELLVVTSDKVYRNPEDGRPFEEHDPLGGQDPYSASKAACEHVVAAWRQSYLGGRGVAVATARAGNVIGGGDLTPGRLVPDFFAARRSDLPVVLRNPTATRPWQFVLEPLVGYLMYVEALHADPEGSPPSLNFGPDLASCWSVSSVVDEMAGLVGSGGWTASGEDLPSEAAALRLDSTAAHAALGWKGRLAVEDALAWTVGWYQLWLDDGDCAALGREQIDAYLELVAN